MKILKCYCNDDITCPLKHFEEQQLETGSTDILRHCSTNTVCLTKRLKRLNGTTWLKYFCDQSSLNSIRGKVIEYRDCRINSTNKLDEKFVIEKSAEYCCDSHDYCNRDLNPINYVRDIEEYSSATSLHQNNHLNNNNNQYNNYQQQHQYDHMNLFTTINLVLLSSLLIFLILTIMLILIYFIKNNKKLIKEKLNNHKLKNHLINQNHHHPLHSSSTTSQQQQHQQPHHSSLLSTTSNSTTTTTSLNSSKENSYNSTSYLFKNNTKYILLQQQQQQNNHNLDYEEQESLLKKILLNKNSILNHHQDNNNIDDGFIESTNLSSISSSSPLNNKNDIKTNSTNSNSCVITSSSSSSSSSTTDENKLNTNHLVNNSNEWSGSGSGAGVPELLQRTIARQIKLLYPCIGKGRFGEVYKGMWRDELVAVKTFNSADEKSWQNECSIYNTSGFRHENILGFIAADNIDRGTYTELWIITEYHKNGSLFDYLNINTITIHDLFKMSISIVNGLDHLHTPIESCTGKPALAHCDLKSKNILVKSDLTCCIGDLGLALSGDKMGNVIFNSQSTTTATTSSFLNNNDILKMNNNNSNNSRIVIRTGTKRYMAPEILSKSINIQSLLEFQYAEMYSLSLIFWELLRRTKLNDLIINYDYKLPYYEYLPIQDPDLEQMYKIVCIDKKRPEIQNEWKLNLILNEYILIIEELWNENAHARLNALRLKKSLNSLYRKYILTNDSII